MPLILKNKQDRQLWMFLTPNQREFAKTGKSLNLTTDSLPEDVSTRFVFAYLHKMIWDYIMTQEPELNWKVGFEGYLKLHFEDGVFKATQHPTKDLHVPFNLPSAIIRTGTYKQLPSKYQELVLSKLDMNFEHISESVIC